MSVRFGRGNHDAGDVIPFPTLECWVTAPSMVPTLDVVGIATCPTGKMMCLEQDECIAESDGERPIGLIRHYVTGEGG